MKLSSVFLFIFTLDVVIEGHVLVPVLLEKTERILIGEVLELDERLLAPP